MLTVKNAELDTVCGITSKLPVNDIFSGLKHDVEQAVVRDLIFAFNSEEESVI